MPSTKSFATASDTGDPIGTPSVFLRTNTHAYSGKKPAVPARKRPETDEGVDAETFLFSLLLSCVNRNLFSYLSFVFLSSLWSNKIFLKFIKEKASQLFRSCDYRGHQLFLFLSYAHQTLIEIGHAFSRRIDRHMCMR